MAELNFTISVNNQQVMRKLAEIQSEMRRTAKVAEESGTGLDKFADRLGKLAASMGLAFGAKELVQNLVKIRGEFQQLDVAFRTMLSSAEKADALMSQLVRTAATTPFDLQGVAQGAKQLLAYGIAAEDVNDTLVRCGDVAAGLSIPLNDLVYLYGTTMTQGRMFTQDLRQFQGRGIPIAEELAKVLGTTTDKLGDMVTAGRVTSDVFQQAFNNMTSAGSRFGGLMDEQSKTITGQISNIEDAIDVMFNKLGQQSEGIINTTLSGVSYIVEHYEQFGRMLLGLVATYGAYKTAVMTAAAAQGWATAAEAIHYNWLVLVERAQKLLNATMLSNPYVLVATAIAGVVAALASMKTEAELVQEATEKYDEEKQKVIEKEEEHRQEIEELTQIASDEATSTTARRDALFALEQYYPQIFKKYRTEYDVLKNIKTIKEEIAALDGKNSIKNVATEAAKVNKRIAELEHLKKTQTLSKIDSYGDRETVIGLTEKQEAELKSLRTRFQQLSRSKEKQNAAEYLNDLSGVSNNELKTAIAQRKKLLNDMKVNGRKVGHFISGPQALRGYFSLSEIEAQINSLVREQNERSAPRASSDKYVANAKKNYEAALKKYNDFIANKSNSLTEAQFAKQRDDLKAALDDAEKEYSRTKTKINKGGKTHRNEAAEREREAAKREQAQRKLNDELIALQAQNEADETAIMHEGSEKRLREIEDEYKKRKETIQKQRRDWIAENKKAGNSVGVDGLTDEQRAALKKADENNEKSRQKSRIELERETLSAELQAMSDYLQQYGTLQEQKYAIAALYAQKIKDVQDSGDSEETKRWRIAALQREQASQISNANAKSLSMGIDWSATFQGVGNILKDVAKATLQKVEDYIKTDEFKALSATDKKTYTDLREQLRLETGGKSTSVFNFRIWGDIDKGAKLYQDAVKNLREKTDAHSAAVRQLEEANKGLANATTDDATKIAQTRVNLEKANVADTGKEMQNAQQKVNETSSNLSTSVSKAANGISNFTNYLNEMSNGSLYNFANGITKLVTSLFKGSDGIGKALSELGGKAGGIVGAILQILDAMGDAPTEFIDTMMEKLIDSINSIIEQLPYLIVSLFKDAGNVIMSLVSGIAHWFKIDDLFGLEGNSKEVAKTIESLTDRNKLLQNSIDSLNKSIKDDNIFKSNEAYEQAKKNQTETNNNLLEIAKAQASYWKGHHSWNYYWEGLSSSQIAWAQKNVKSNFNGDIWSLSPEEMKKLLANVDIAEAIRGTGEGNFGKDVLEKLQAYAEQAEKIEEYTKQWQENIAKVSFDTMKDNFVSALMDMSKDAKDFADDFTELMQRALLSVALQDLIDKDLKQWYESYVTALSNGTLTELQKDYFKDALNEIYKKGTEIRDNIADFTGYDNYTQQSGDSGGFEAMSQDTAEELSGRFTMLQITAQNIHIDVLSLLNKMDTSIAISTVRNTLLQEVVTIMNRSTSYLEDIAADTRRIRNEFGEKIDEMNTRLRVIAG
nr:MAG TPA: tail tape measure protein [Caudoviricetes sp.]